MTSQAARLAELSERVTACLPPRLAAHVRLANIRDGCLVLQADSSAWATQVRYKAPEILAALGGEPEFAGVRSIRVRNAPRDYEPPAATRRATLSASSAASIDAQADTITDPALRAALHRLTRRRR